MSSETTYMKLLDKIEDQLNTLNLGRSVVRGVMQDDGSFNHSGVVLTWETERPTDGTNERDDVAYTAIVVIAGGSTKAWSTDMPDIDSIRDKVFKAFNNKRIFLNDSVDSPLPTKVIFGPIGLPEKWVKNRSVGLIQIQTKYRRRRG